MSLCLGRERKVGKRDKESKPVWGGLGTPKLNVGFILGLERRLLSVELGLQFEFKVNLVTRTEI